MLYPDLQEFIELCKTYKSDIGLSSSSLSSVAWDAMLCDRPFKLVLVEPFEQ
ncbi:hypothetical protein QUB60_19730 [Microcoleus sp. A2-C5]|uniref:hypothetical protein n=1 Tax=Microcoleaceae TaxID=1892252 RepID=UPI002238D92C|nr:hypothetical protein [Lyngbya sp. CCAP 1446/10]MCW6050232.1 hypothetical protein [Lyngbya sp. CCAP 1446/10]